MTEWIWLLVVCAGAAALGAFIFYGERKTEEPESPAATRRREVATHDIYEKAEQGRD